MSNPNGEMQFWFNGFPFNGVQISGKDNGEMQFWWAGFPLTYIFPAAAGGGGAQPIPPQIIIW